MGIMEMSEVSLPQFLHKASCSSPREIPAGMPRRYCSSNNKHGVVTRAEGEGVNFPTAGARGGSVTRGAARGFPEGGGLSPQIGSPGASGSNQGGPNTAAMPGDGHNPLWTLQSPPEPFPLFTLSSPDKPPSTFAAQQKRFQAP